jgi:hypothetical protein
MRESMIHPKVDMDTDQRNALFRRKHLNIEEIVVQPKFPQLPTFC